MKSPAIQFHRVPATGKDSLRPPRLQRWMALHRHGDYWIGPAWGRAEDPLPDKTLCVLWETTSGSCGAAVALVDGDLSAWLEGRWNLRATGCLPGTEPASALLLATATGAEPHALLQQLMAAVAAQLGTFRLREQKATPEFINWLGWCTWDAFYQTVNHAKVVASLKALNRARVPVRFMILDDGWLDVKPRDWLRGFQANPDKFPRGLPGLIREAKERHGIRIFGVWHAFQGYWAGLDPESRLAQQYRTVTNRGVLRPWEPGPPVVDLHLVHPDDAQRFFADWYAELSRAGVDMVKVDGQNATAIFSAGKLGQVSTMRALHQAMQAAAVMRFGGQVINCMSNSLDVALHLAAGNVWRNTVDYFPTERKGPLPEGETESHRKPNPPRVHQWHIAANAYNAVWTSTFLIPDWDGFQSAQVESHFHALARAISGGPVYFNDSPGFSNPALVKRLATTDGRVLRCPQPAVAARDCLFTNVMREPRLLKVINRAGGVGMAAAFHCKFRDREAPAAPIAGFVTPSDLQGVDGKRFACLRPSTGELRVLGRSGRFPLTLGEMEADAVIMAPITRGIAPFGLLDKYCPPAAIEQHDWLDARQWMLRLCEGGQIGIYCAQRPRAVAVNGRTVRTTWKKNGLLTLQAPSGKPAIVLVTLSLR